MALFRQVYRVRTASGARRLQAVLLEGTTAVDARASAVDMIRAECPGLEIELVGTAEPVELPQHFLLGEETT